MTPTTPKSLSPANDDFLSSLPSLGDLVKRTVALDSGRSAASLPAVDSSAAAAEPAPAVAPPMSPACNNTAANNTSAMNTVSMNTVSMNAESNAAVTPAFNLAGMGSPHDAVAGESMGAGRTTASMTAQQPDSAKSTQAKSTQAATANEVSEGDEYEETHSAPMEHERIQRKIVLPILLFIATCLSTFWVGVTHFQPVQLLPALFTATGGDPVWGRRLILEHWHEGLIYMACVMGILLVHELGHFIATVIYRVRASLPMFLPFPFNPIGTFGAVIGMNGGQADRKQLFDIGIAGPLAGLVIAFPVMIVGVMTIDVTAEASGDLQMNCPLGVSLLIQWLRPDIDLNDGYLWLGHANSWFVAGWVGFLITGLNMMPVSQLDGGHVIYALLGKGAHWVARGVMVLGIGFMFYFEAPTMVLMAFLIFIVGTDHPRTRDDSVKLGSFRTILGWISLVIPILCFPPFIFRMV